MRTKFILTFLFLGALFPKAFGCQCGAPAGHNPWEIAERRIQGSSTVFEGKVVALRFQWHRLDAKEGEWVTMEDYGIRHPDRSPRIVATIEVLRMHRGEIPSSVEVSTGVGGGDCGFLFEVGEQYLVFAQKDEAGRYRTSNCSATAPLKGNTPELRYLRGERPRPEDLINFWEHAKLSEAGRRRELERPSKYGRVCVKIPTATDENDEVVLMRAKADPHFQFERSTYLRDGNRFCANEVWPGTYVALHLKYRASRTGPKQMSYYPGVYYRKEAAPFEVRAGEEVEIAFRPYKIETQAVAFYLLASNLESIGNQHPGLHIRLLGLDGQPMSRMYLADIKVSDVAKWTHIARIDIPEVLPGRYLVWIDEYRGDWAMRRQTITVADRSQSVFIRLKKTE